MSASTWDGRAERREGGRQGEGNGICQAEAEGVWELSEMHPDKSELMVTATAPTGLHGRFHMLWGAEELFGFHCSERS